MCLQLAGLAGAPVRACVCACVRACVRAYACVRGAYACVRHNLQDSRVHLSECDVEMLTLDGELCNDDGEIGAAEFATIMRREMNVYLQDNIHIYIYNELYNILRQTLITLRLSTDSKKMGIELVEFWSLMDRPA